MVLFRIFWVSAWFERTPRRSPVRVMRPSFPPFDPSHSLTHLFFFQDRFYVVVIPHRLSFNRCYAWARFLADRAGFDALFFVLLLRLKSTFVPGGVLGRSSCRFLGSKPPLEASMAVINALDSTKCDATDAVVRARCDPSPFLGCMHPYPTRSIGRGLSSSLSRFNFPLRG